VGSWEEKYSVGKMGKKGTGDGRHSSTHDKPGERTFREGEKREGPAQFWKRITQIPERG